HRGYQRAIANLENEIDAIEKEIEKIVQSDSDLNDNYKLITSIKGIGPVIANNLIIKTKNFKRINTAKKAAAFAGVCPYPNSSGKMSMKSKTSHMADKKLKSLLILAAKTEVTHKNEHSLDAERNKLDRKYYFWWFNYGTSRMLRTVYGVIQRREACDMNRTCNDARQLN